ncbi:MAG: hypothetical protein AAFO83_15380 [Cyanobacteria bacterium J06607_13]
MSSSVLGTGAGPAGSPEDSRLVAAVFLELSRVYYQGRRVWSKRVHRWDAIVHIYHSITEAVMSCATLTRDAPMQLFAVNERTVRLW